MSNLVDLYNTTTKKRPQEARDRIPDQEANYFDRERKFSKGFLTGKKKLSPTSYTAQALDHYVTLVNQKTPPESFNPASPFHRYTDVNSFDPTGKGDNSQQ